MIINPIVTYINESNNIVLIFFTIIKRQTKITKVVQILLKYTGCILTSIFLQITNTPPNRSKTSRKLNDIVIIRKRGGGG